MCEFIDQKQRTSNVKMNCDDMFEVDGSVMEGGGQIIRMSIAFSALLGKSIKLSNIRAGRAKPGLQAQHMTGIKLASELCGARLDGCQLQSTTVQFVPGVTRSTSSEFSADIKTAGATTLLAQIALPYILLGRNSTTLLDLKGGTNADFAPQVEYYSQAFLPIMSKFGVTAKCDVIRKGYFPKGGGQVRLEVPSIGELKAVDMTDFGELKSVSIYSSVAGTLNVKLAHEMAKSAKDVVAKHLGGRQSSVQIYVDAYKETNACSNGNSISIFAETSTGCILGSGGIGSRGKSGAALGAEAAEELIGDLKLRACLDQHLQDQVIIFMALANGVSRVRTGPLTLHTRTAIHVAEMLSGATFKVEESSVEKGVHFIECQGIHFKNSRKN